MYKDIGDGWNDGVPARDLTEDEFNALPKEKQESVRQSKLYHFEKKQRIVKGDQE